MWRAVAPSISTMNRALHSAVRAPTRESKKPIGDRHRGDEEEKADCDFRRRRAANARRSAISSGDGVFNFLDRVHDFPIQNKRARRRADLWMILFHAREIRRENIADGFSIRAPLIGSAFF